MRAILLHLPHDHTFAEGVFGTSIQEAPSVNDQAEEETCGDPVKPSGTPRLPGGASPSWPSQVGNEPREAGS